MDSSKVQFFSGNLSAPHAFFTRKGGVTPGHLGSLNCGSSFDDAANIRENQARAMASFGFAPERLCILKQVHSPKVHIVADEIPPRTLEGDALVTKRTNTVLGILTADCVPVLFHDATAGIIGAAHAGWKGASGGVLEATLTAMDSIGADRTRIHAAIGACIRQPSYEVGPEYHTQFLALSPANHIFFIASDKPGHYLFDLPGYVKWRLLEAGIHAVDDIGYDTRTEEDLFFSCRRAHLKGEKGFGNGLSAIGLK